MRQAILGKETFRHQTKDIKTFDHKQHKRVANLRGSPLTRGYVHQTVVSYIIHLIRDNTILQHLIAIFTFGYPHGVSLRT